LLEHINQPSHSPDLTPGDHDLFIYLKNWLWSQHLKNNEVMEGVKRCLSSNAAEFFDTSIHNLFPDKIASILVVTMFNSS
jgi:hypothetical protein